MRQVPLEIIKELADLEEGNKILAEMERVKRLSNNALLIDIAEKIVTLRSIDDWPYKKAKRYVQFVWNFLYEVFRHKENSAYEIAE